MPAERVRDVLVVGGGPAGLSAALLLGRSRRDVLVVDAGSPRNAPADHVRGYLGADGVPPGELVARGRAEVRRYGVELRDGRVVELRADPDAVVARTDDGTVLRARRVLVATGLQDVLPDVPGLADRWGRDVLHCPYCHGWEVRDARIAVHVTRPEQLGKAWAVRQWSEDLTVLLDGLAHEDLDDADVERADVLRVRLVEGSPTGLAVADDALTGVRLADGSVLAADVLVVEPTLRACDELLVAAGAEVVAEAFGEVVVSDDDGATGVPGVWAAGNVTDPQAQVVLAAAAGYRAALAIDHDLVLADVDVAVGRARAGGSAEAGR